MINPEEYRTSWNLPYVDHWTSVEYPQIEAAYRSAHGGESPNEVWAAFQTYRRYMEPNVWTFEKMLEWESTGGHPNPTPPTNPNPPVQQLRVDGPVFRDSNNNIIKLKGFTSFPLINRFEHGHFIENILDDFAGYNAPRIFLYVPEKDWHADAWGLPSKEAAYECIKELNSKGYYPKITLGTDDDQSKIEPIKEIVRYLEDKNIVVLYEAVNEPNVGGKFDPVIFDDVLKNSKFLYTSGIYHDNRLFWGKYWVDHSPRDAQWYRKGGHNLMEAYNGGGPSFPEEPALRRAGIEDEPIKPHQMGYNADLMYQYAASVGLFGNGTFHCESGKFCRKLNQGELDCKNAFLRGLDIFPADAPFGITSYDRIVEPGNEVGGHNESGRTFIGGNHSVRIHQEGLNHPWGWKPLDNQGVAFVKP